MAKLWRRLAGWWRRDAIEDALRDELEQHRALKRAALEQLGRSPDQADLESRRALGNVTLAREDAADAASLVWLEQLLRDVRLGIRRLAANPTVAITVGFTLALGIGANTAVFSVLNGVLFSPLPFRAADRVVLLWTDDARRGLHEQPASLPTVTDWKTRNRSFTDLAIYSKNAVVLPEGDTPERTTSAFVSANLFDVLGVSPLRGRSFTAAEEENRDDRVVISHGLWQRKFGGDPSAIGRRITIDGDMNSWKGGPRSPEIIGVMPPGFFFPDASVEIWEPATVYWRWSREAAERDMARLNVVARLRPSASAEDARGDMQRIGRDLEAAFPARIAASGSYTARVVPILEQITGASFTRTLWLLMGAVTLVLLIACANVANLLLARGAARQQEFAIQIALGAGRRRLIRQMLIESQVLAAGAGVAGFALAAATIRLLVASAPVSLPRLDHVSLDGRVLAFTASATLVAGLVFGILPAIRAARSAPQGGLRATQPSDRLGRRTRTVLLASEAAIAVLLLAGSGLLVKSLVRLNAVDPGFNPNGLVVARVAMPAMGQKNAPAAVLFGEQQRRLEAIAGRIAAESSVESVGIVTSFVIDGSADDSIEIVGDAPGAHSAGPLKATAVSRNFFATMGTPIVQGRGFVAEDLPRKAAYYASLDPALPPEPVIVNTAFARRFFGATDPIARRFCFGPATKHYCYEIVGVAADMHRQGLEREPISEYFPLAFGPQTADLMIRTASDGATLMTRIRTLVARAEPGAKVLALSTAEQRLAGFTVERRFQTWLFSAFAALALLLAASGIYGVVRYSVAQRTREIGVRVALGAHPIDILWLVTSEGLRAPVAGIAIGLIAASLLVRSIASSLFGIAPTDPLTFAEVALALAVVAMAACAFPARRAVRVDPLRALREN